MTQQNKQLTNIVITGGCGFIGVNLVRYLLKLEENIRIRIVDNFGVGQPEDLGKRCAIKRLEANQLNGWQDGVSLVEGDILDEGVAELEVHRYDVATNTWAYKVPYTVPAPATRIVGNWSAYDAGLDKFFSYGSIWSNSTSPCDPDCPVGYTPGGVQAYIFVYEDIAP